MMQSISHFLGVLGLCTYAIAVGTLPDYVAEDANIVVHMNLKNCGNGRLDPGEECDCGPGTQKCLEDPCCQTNCQLKLHAQCSESDDGCCDKCKYRPKWTVCQSAGTDCEISEYCPGGRGGCPVLSYKRNGANCTGDYGWGVCVSGTCRSFDQPCHSDAHTMQSDQWRCSVGFICINQSCIPLSEVVQGNSVCSRGANGLECSGNGDCTTTLTCHCNAGWKGSTCSRQDLSNSSRINLEKPGIVKGLGPEQRDGNPNTSILVGGLVTFVIVVSVIFIVMAFRYLPARPLKDESGSEVIQGGGDHGDNLRSSSDHHHNPNETINNI